MIAYKAKNYTTFFLFFVFSLSFPCYIGKAERLSLSQVDFQHYEPNQIYYTIIIERPMLAFTSTSYNFEGYSKMR